MKLCKACRNLTKALGEIITTGLEEDWATEMKLDNIHITAVKVTSTKKKRFTFPHILESKICFYLKQSCAHKH